MNGAPRTPGRTELEFGGLELTFGALSAYRAGRGVCGGTGWLWGGREQFNAGKPEWMLMVEILGDDELDPRP